ncbi:MAG: hypothetical protein QNJ00_11910 [Woeseiaceae bacterium]|nr:hypothetical protein [Woeseiaceae bacterium]
MDDDDLLDIPLSQSNVSLRLADIQRRCSELIHDPDDLGGLELADEPKPVVDNSNPYDRG